MNDSNTQSGTLTPEEFRAWVVAATGIHRAFSEQLHDAADLVATIDPALARGLYRAADLTYETAYRMQGSAPVPEASSKLSRSRYLLFGFLFGLFTTGVW